MQFRMLLFASLLCFADMLCAAPRNINNVGFVMGQLSKIRFEGNTGKIIQGTIFLGKESEARRSRSGKHSNQPRDAIRNPVRFCAESRWTNRLDEILGEYVVVQFKTPKKSSLIQCDGDMELLDAYRITKENYRFDYSEWNNIPSANSLNFGRIEIVVGRIVSAIESGKHLISREIIVQEGNSGDNFISLKIDHEDLFNFAVHCLQFGTRVKVYHGEKFAHSSRSHSSINTIWKIKHLNEL